MKIKDYRDAQLHYTKDDRGDATGAFEMFVAEVPRSEMDNFNTPDLEQSPDSFLKPGETLEDFDVTFRRPNAEGGRAEFQFGGGADAQAKGTEASRIYFKNRPVDKPTPTFEGPAGGAKVTDVKFKNPTQEKEYIKILEDRFKFPKGSKEARKVASNADIAKKFGISLNNVERVNKALINKLNLKYPAQTYEGYEKIQRERDKLRKENIKKTSSTGVESKIKRDIKKVDPTALANDVDLAHRASLKANANLGANYLTTSIGIDAKIVNQKIIKPTEQKLGKLYNDQMNLIKDYKPGDKIPKDVQKKLEKINIKISELADRTNGVLQGVLVDEKTLKPRTYGVDYSKVLGFGLVDKPVSELTQADRDIIKLNVKEQIKTAKKNVPKKQKNNPKIIEDMTQKLGTLGCPKGLPAASGGRIKFNKGGACVLKGKRILAEGLKNGFKKGNQAILATAILKTGKGLKDIASIRALLGPAAIGFIAAEQAAYVGYDMLSKGKSFKEAIGDSAFNYLTGDKTKIDATKERNKRMIEEGMTSEQMGKIGAYESALKEEDRILNVFDKLDTAEQGQLDEMARDPNFSYLPDRTKEFKKQEDEARADLRDIGKTGAINKVLSVDAQGGVDALAEGLRRNELAQLQSVDNIFQSRKGDANRFQKKRELMLQNPDILNYMGPYPTTLGFAGGGIAGLSGGDKSGRPPESGPASQGLRSLIKNGRKL